MLSSLLIATADPKYDGNADKIVAGWLGFVVLMALIVATVLLLWNFTKQLKKTKAARDAGVFGDEPPTDEPPVDEKPTTED